MSMLFQDQERFTAIDTDLDFFVRYFKEYLRFSPPERAEESEQAKDILEKVHELRVLLTEFAGI